MREVILSTELPGMRSFVTRLPEDEQNEKTQADEKSQVTYINYLKVLEKNNQIKSIKKLHQKVVRQRKELEFW